MTSQPIFERIREEMEQLSQGILRLCIKRYFLTLFLILMFVGLWENYSFKGNGGNPFSYLI